MPSSPSEHNGKFGEQFRYDPEFRGPIKNRSCTDIICLFLFIAFIAGWIVVGVFAFRAGDLKVLFYPTDSEGNMCGVDELKNKSYLLFFDLRKCASPKVIYSGCPTPQVCVSTCPTENFIPTVSGDPEKDKRTKEKLICEYDVNKDSKTLQELLDEGHCATLYLKSSPLLGRCIPDIFKQGIDKYLTDKHGKVMQDEGDKITAEQIKNATANIEKFLKLTEIGAKVFGDFVIAWKEMLVGLVAAMVLSLIWIVLMRWLAGPMTYLSIILILAFCVFGCYYSTDRYIKLKDVAGSERKFEVTLNLKSYLELRKTWLALAIICGVIFGILFLVVVFLRKRIYIAIALIVQSSKAVGCMSSTLFFPIFPYILQFAFFAFWIAIALYIASSGKASFVIADAPAGSSHANGSHCNPKKYNSTGEGIKCLFQSYGLRDNLFSAHVYNLFGLFWSQFFVIGLGQLSLAGAFASYYWTHNKKDVPFFAVGTSLGRTCRYHLGSVAFGSLLIACVRMIRVMLEYIDRKCKKYDNAFTKCIIWCMKCCFYCLEKFLRFISKNAYIMIAVYGKNFCRSARKAFMLLMRNVLRVIVIDKLTDFLLFLGKLVVVVTVGVLSFYYFTTYSGSTKDQLNYKITPPIVITVGAYIIASAFFSVYGMAVDTLFLCFLEDCERNDGSPEKPYYMSKDLMKLLHKKNKFRELQSPTSSK
nr:choline transporter-like protein 4 [Parasteatoda tepidariorum]